MPDYGYNPSQYANDFSWISRIGDSIAKFAYQMPELIELNKTIKENNKAKDILYSSTNKYIDKLDPKIISNIVSSMKLDVDPNSPNYDQAARTALKKNIPTFTSSTKNEDYTNNLVNYFVPMLQAAQSDAGGGKLSYGDLLAGIDTNAIQEGINKSTFGQQQIKDAEYDKSVQRSDTEYNKNIERRLDPINGEVKRTNDLNNQSAMSLDQSKYDTEQSRMNEEGSKYAPIVEEAVNSGMDATQVYADVYKKTNNIQVAKEASDRVRMRDSDDLRMELQKMQDEFKKDATHDKELSKIYDKTELTDKIDKVGGNIANLQMRLENKNLKMSDSEKAEIKATINTLKKQQRIYEKAMSENIQTVGDANKALDKATRSIDPEDEQKMIDAFNNNISKKQGGFSGTSADPRSWGRGDDIKRFEVAYFERFGKMPVVTKNSEGKYIISKQMSSGSSPTPDVAHNNTPPVAGTKIGGYDQNPQQTSTSSPTSDAINVDGWTQSKLDALPAGTKIMYKGKIYISKGKK